MLFGWQLLLLLLLLSLLSLPFLGPGVGLCCLALRCFALAQSSGSAAGHRRPKCATRSPRHPHLPLVPLPISYGIPACEAYTRPERFHHSKLPRGRHCGASTLKKACIAPACSRASLPSLALAGIQLKQSTSFSISISSKCATSPPATPPPSLPSLPPLAASHETVTRFFIQNPNPWTATLAYAISFFPLAAARHLCTAYPATTPRRCPSQL